MEALGRWRSFLDSLDTGGGHIFIVFCLVPIGAALFYFDATAGGQIMTGALSAMYVMLRNKGTNKDQLTGPPAMTATVTTAPAPQPAPTPIPNSEGEPK